MRRQRRHFGVQRRVDEEPADGRREAHREPLLRVERRHELELSVAEDRGGHGELVEQRIGRVAEPERWGGLEARAIHGADQAVHLPHGLQAARREDGEQIEDSGRRAHAENGHETGSFERRRQLELAPGHVEQAAEIDVVRARCQRAFHGRQVEAVGERCDGGEGAVQGAPQARRIEDVRLHRLDAELARGGRVAVRDDHLHGAAAGTREVARRDLPHGARAAQDDDAGLVDAGATDLPGAHAQYHPIGRSLKFTCTCLSSR